MGSNLATSFFRFSEHGVEHWIGFVEWINTLGATVDRSYGSIIGTSDTKVVVEPRGMRFTMGSASQGMAV